ncbi:hypothetical protein M430DRAFT_109925 [Amorphotheca resinae ATCC 22711]|uniref:Zn(2)-C6 fungal-type domain-containing protein n=1 Tax=Amorphotheca resinae ATCC 22711 TaxID=857342 RepID=A0A2T3AQF2_AMORE|nr:hypothetical protein M430DRAFT_109925 [Amorphotheca resinae ATCC 22711]PSS08493.1 hypothetical protein M430DRAFT_109925 [Amorphotheca resinae ATCC 22711]
MRLGTRSCAECRRRKVRCVYPPNNPTCEECALHDVRCTPQRPGTQRTTRTGRAHGLVDLQRRLEDLEGTVRRVCNAIDPSLGSLSLAELETNVTEALARLRPVPLPETIGEDASMNRTNTVNFSGSESESLNLNRLIPRLDSLTLILELTEKYWPLWPAIPERPVTSSDQLEPGSVASARDFILDSLGSGTPAAVAKSVLWLALCIQQLPRDFGNRCSNLPASPNDLINSYLSGAETLLLVDEDTGGTREGLEALALQSKLYIDMGRPRKAWLTIRRGLNLAILLGLHHPDESTSIRQKALWSYFWQFDRQLSLILGFPYAIVDSHPGISEVHIEDSIEARAMHRLSIIAGHIIERNQNHRHVGYAATVRINQELEQFRDEIPQHWWDAIPSSTMSLEALHDQQAVKLIYYQLQKFLHLPYMLKSPVDKRFENSRVLALEASRKMIGCYQTLRNGSGQSIIICDLMDFQVFTAAVTIVINLLSQSSECSVHQQDEDWELVQCTARSLKDVSIKLECAVAGQAAQLLEYLLEVHHGLYTGPESYQAVIPYFGKVKISQPKSAASQTGLTPRIDHQSPTSCPFPQVVEFSANSFVPFSQNYVADYLAETELGVDWTAVFDENMDYEYSQLFP